jgi:hypothetical protein
LSLQDLSGALGKTFKGAKLDYERVLDGKACAAVGKMHRAGVNLPAFLSVSLEIAC